MLRVRVALIDNKKKMRETCLRWFGHAQRRVTNALMRKRKFIQVKRGKKKRTPKLTLVEVVKNDKGN